MTSCGPGIDLLTELRQNPAFKLLPQEILHDFAPSLGIIHLKRGEVAFSQGQAPLSHLFLTIKGVAEIVVTSETGDETVIAMRRPYDFFGETGLIEKAYPATVRVVDDMTCITIPIVELDKLLDTHAGFAGYFSRLIASHFAAMINEVAHEQTSEALGIDSKPFRKRACDIMTTPVHSVSVGASISEVAQVMSERGIGALLVLEGEKPVGIVTERDLVQKVLTRPSYRPTLSEVINRQLMVLPPDAYYYQVLLTMVREKARYVLIMEGEKILGIVALADLIRSRDTGALGIVNSIERSKNVEGLQKATLEIDKVLMAMVMEKAQAFEINEVISEMYDRLTIRVIELSIEEMERQGLGKPPVPFCWLNMGSGGRKEQTVRTDQDNAIIFENVSADRLDEVRSYFLKLASIAVDGLESCGFARCRGDVMASNPKWCRSLSAWVSQMDVWVEESVSEHVRMMTIFLDFRGVYGDRLLADRLRSEIHSLYKRYPIGLHHLAKDDLQHQVALGFFRPFITEKSKEHKDEIDLKRAVMVHVADCVRIFALREGINDVNTMARIRRLKDIGVFHAENADAYLAGFEFLMNLRIKENLRKYKEGKEPDNYINPYQLSKKDQAELKEAFRSVMSLQNFTGSIFRVEGFL